MGFVLVGVCPSGLLSYTRNVKPYNFDIVTQEVRLLGRVNVTYSTILT